MSERVVAALNSCPPDDLARARGAKSPDELYKRLSWELTFERDRDDADSMLLTALYHGVGSVDLVRGPFLQYLRQLSLPNFSDLRTLLRKEQAFAARVLYEARCGGASRETGGDNTLDDDSPFGTPPKPTDGPKRGRTPSQVLVKWERAVYDEFKRRGLDCYEFTKQYEKHLGGRKPSDLKKLIDRVNHRK